jgi:neutral ceramidase
MNRTATPLNHFLVLASLLCLSLTLKAELSAQDRSEYLLAGAATSNITPELGGEIIGGFLPIPAKHIHDDLHARCLVLDDGETKIALVVCDLLGIHRSLSIEARRQITDATGIPPENVLISATHTHSATSAISNAAVARSYQSDMPLNDYQKFVCRRIADGVRRAIQNLQPAEIAFGRVDVPEHLFNRRWFLKEGAMPVNPFGQMDKVKMNPPANSPDLVEPAGPIDPTLSFFALRAPGGNLISLYSAYSLHYVGDVGAGHISADYFSIYCERLKQNVSSGTIDPPFVALLANGTSGDINNIPFGKPRATRPTYGQMTYVAEDLAHKVREVIPSLTWQKKQKLAARYRELDLKWREVDSDLMKWAEETSAKATSLQGADLPAIYARRVKELAQASPQTKAPVQLLVIGDIAIGCSPCETFAEIGIEFRNRSPFPNSFMVELAHGYYGYLPTPRHFELGGYETWPGTNYLEPQASVKIMDALLEMATEVKGL